MKKLLLIALAVALTLFVIACGGGGDDSGDGAQPTPAGGGDPTVDPGDGPADTPPGEDDDTPETPLPDGVLVFVDFEDGTTMGFDVRGTDDEKASGTGVLTVSTEVARSGERSLLITDRKRNWNGIAYNIASLVEANTEYVITFWVHARTPDKSEFILSTQIGDGSGGTQYVNMKNASISVDDGWVEMQANYIYTTPADFITVYIENSDVSAEFFVDDFSVATADSSGVAWNPLEDPITSDRKGTYLDFDFEFWSEKGEDGSMLLTGNGTFVCEWGSPTRGASNILFRTGKRLGSISPYTEYGDISIEYEAEYEIITGAVSYLTAYGWTEDPLVEWYVVERHGNYRPGNEYVGEFTVDGGVYEVYVDTRVDKPSIQGTQTFLQVFSIRKEHRTSGTISLSEHFAFWESLGYDVGGNLYEVSMCIEGYQSSGTGAITRHILTVGDDVYGSE